MDKLTKHYIDDMVRPLVNRIEHLERNNEELKIQVKYLQSLVSQKTYLKPTVSATHQMRDSRISSKIQSSEKRPGWNSKTKLEQSLAASKQAISIEKQKLKPPIPKVVKSPVKILIKQEIGAQSQKKIAGGTKYSQDNSSKEYNEKSRQKKSTEASQQKRSQQRAGHFGINKFEELVKSNNTILNEMKKNNEKVRQNIKIQNHLPPPSNYVEKGLSPKSEYNRSLANSPNDRSLASYTPQDNVAGLNHLKINFETAMAKIELK